MIPRPGCEFTQPSLSLFSFVCTYFILRKQNELHRHAVIIYESGSCSLDGTFVH